MILPIGDDVAEMLNSPGQQRIQKRHKALSSLRKAIFNPWWHFHKHLAADNAVVL